MNCENRLYFSSDYMEGAHPAILARLTEMNMVHSSGYGTDTFSEAATSACTRPAP